MDLTMCYLALAVEVLATFAVRRNLLIGSRTTSKRYRERRHLLRYSGVLNTNSGFPSWSPDCKSLVFSQDAHLVVWDLKSGSKRNLTVFSSAWMGFKDEHALSESPQPYGQLFMIHPDGSGLRRLTDNKWEAGTAGWIKQVQ